MKKQRSPKRPRRGKGKLTDLLKKGNAFLKRTKLISRAAGAVAPHVQWVKPIEMLAKSYGYGKRKKGRKLRGRGFIDWIKNKALPWLKKTKIISTIGSALAPIPGIGSVAGIVGKVAGAAGYGRRRRVGRPRIRGRGMNQQTGAGFGGSNAYSSGVVGLGKMRGRAIRGRAIRGRGIGHLNTGLAHVGMPGAANYSSGRVQF